MSVYPAVVYNDDHRAFGFCRCGASSDAAGIEFLKPWLEKHRDCAEQQPSVYHSKCETRASRFSAKWCGLPRGHFEPHAFALDQVVEGRKDDAGKLRYTLLPLDALESVVRVLEHGAAKYGVGNWRHVPDLQQRYVDATLRHVLAHQRGETTDPESGLPHLAHAVCSLLFLLETRSER